MQTSSLNYVTKSDLQYKTQQNEKGKFSNVEVFQKLHQDEIIYDAIKEVLFDYNISPYSLATDIELSVQTSFILG